VQVNIIYNKDCLEVLKNIPDESIDLVVTDPPYKIVAGGVSIERREDEPSGCLNRRYKVISDGTKCSNKWLKKNPNNIPCAVKAGKMFIHNDIKFSEWLPEIYRVLKKRTHAYIMINARNLKELQVEAEKVGFVFQNLLVWDKMTSGTPNKFYMQKLEFILLLSKRPARYINDMGMGNLFRIPNPKNKQHPTQKPIELFDIFIRNSSNEGDIVLDPFMGVGTTAMSCVRNNRKYIGCEIDEDYYKICQENIKKAEGKTGLFAL